MSLRPGAVGAGRKGGLGGRMKRYKVGLDADEGRRRREEGLVEIRKGKRGDSLTKKRREHAPSAVGVPGSGPSADDLGRSLTADCYTVKQGTCCSLHKDGQPSPSDHLERIPEIAQQLWSEDVSIQMDATTYLRIFLSKGDNPSIDVVLTAGVVPRIVQFLLRQDEPSLQFEAAWILTNIASGTSEHTQVVIEHGVVPILVQLLNSPNEEVQEQAVWALGNIAGNSSSCRDVVLESGVITPLLSLLNPRSRLSLIRNAAWTLSNLLYGKPLVNINKIKPALVVLQQLIHSNDDDILESICWAFSFLSSGTDDTVQAVLDANVCPRIIKLLEFPTLSVISPALKTLGNLAAGSDTQTQIIMDYGLLPCLLQFLTQSHPIYVKRDACWIISNITAGTKSQIQAVIDANICPTLVHLLANSEFAVKKEAAWAVSNAICGGSFEQVHFLASLGCVKPLCDLLTCVDSAILMICLESLEAILKVGEASKDSGDGNGSNEYLQQVEDCEGLDKIENLQGHDNSQIYGRVIEILEKYWDEEETDGDDLQGAGDGMGHVLGADQRGCPKVCTS